MFAVATTGLLTYILATVYGSVTAPDDIWWVILGGMGWTVFALAAWIKL